MRPELATDGDNGMEPNQTEEDFIRSSLEIFDGNFMIDEDVELREMFRKHPDVLAFLKKAYTIGGDKKTVDLCLEAIWEDLNEMAKSMGDYIWNPPKWTEEELRRSIEANAERIRRAAKGWDTTGEWQRAMGVTPIIKQPEKGIWNPTTYTKEELERAEAFRAEMIRNEARGWDISGEWQRAMGVTPREEADEQA